MFGLQPLAGKWLCEDFFFLEGELVGVGAVADEEVEDEWLEGLDDNRVWFLEDWGLCRGNAHWAENKINFIYIHAIVFIGVVIRSSEDVTKINVCLGQSWKKSLDSQIRLCFGLGLLSLIEQPPS